MVRGGARLPGQGPRFLSGDDVLGAAPPYRSQKLTWTRVANPLTSPGLTPGGSDSRRSH